MNSKKIPFILSLFVLSALLLCSCSNGSNPSGTFIAKDAESAMFDSITFQSDNAGLIVENGEEKSFLYNVVAGYIRFNPQDPDDAESLPSKSVPFVNAGSSITINGQDYLLTSS